MMDLKELSSKLKVHPNTIRNYIKDGMPHIQLKRKYLFDYDKVIEWLEKTNLKDVNLKISSKDNKIIIEKWEKGE